MNKTQRKKVKTDFTTNRTFEYIRGDVTLKFTLSIDNSSQLAAFKNCLEYALEDVSQTLEEVENGSNS